MGSIGHAIYAFDKRLFAWIRTSLGGESLDGFSAYASNLYFWTPFLIFLLVLLLNTHKRSFFLNVLYSLGTIVLSFQAAFLLAHIFAQPAPYAVEMILHNLVLPATPPDSYILTTDDYSFPDWETAAMTAALFFVRGRVKRLAGRFPRALWLPVLIFGFFRVYAGHAYPYDTSAGWLLGCVVGWILLVFARNMDVVLNPGLRGPASTASAEFEEKAGTSVES